MLLLEAKNLFPAKQKIAPENAIGYIYVTFEPISGNFYIGKQTRKEWCESYYGSGKFPLQWLKENLHLEHWPIQWCYSKDELNQAEFDWIDKFKNHDDIVNIITGGEHAGFTPINERAAKIRSDTFKRENNPAYGKHLSDETKQKIRDTKKEYFKTHNGSFKGKHHTEESKQKLSKSHKEYYKTHDGIFKGKHHTEETKQKMSKSQKEYYKTHENKCKGIHHTEESRRHMSEGRKEYYKTHDAPMKGRKHTEEAKKKMSKIAKTRCNSPNYIHNQSKSVRCIETGEVFKSTIEAAKSLGKKGSHICDVCNGNREKALGYHWEWVKDE